MVLDQSLQDDVQKEIRRIRSADRLKMSTNAVETKILENLHGSGTAREFTFEYDEPSYVAGGENRGPRPLEYFLAGWAFCQQVQYARNALASGVEIADLEMVASGDIDPKSSLSEDDGGVQSGFVDDELELTTNIESDAHPDEIRELARQAKADCHAHASLERQMTLESDVLLNGELLDL